MFANEISFCDGKPNPSIHFAGRFAAKEAVKKALLSSNKHKNISLRNIEIHNKHDGCPIVIIRNDNYSSININVSISHTDHYASATAIFEIK